VLTINEFNRKSISTKAMKLLSKRNHKNMNTKNNKEIETLIKSRSASEIHSMADINNFSPETILVLTIDPYKFPFKKDIHVQVYEDLSSYRGDGIMSNGFASDHPQLMGFAYDLDGKEVA